MCVKFLKYLFLSLSDVFLTFVFLLHVCTQDQQAVRFGFCLPTYLLNPILEHVAGLQVPLPLPL